MKYLAGSDDESIFRMSGESQKGWEFTKNESLGFINKRTSADIWRALS